MRAFNEEENGAIVYIKDTDHTSDTETDRQTDWLTDRQTGRQTDHTARRGFFLNTDLTKKIAYSDSKIPVLSP